MATSSNLYDTYASLLKEYSEKFGKKTIIFLLVGSFYELYDTQNTETGEYSLNIKDVTDYLGLQVAIHKGQGSNNTDGIVAGFPDYALHKWAGRLTSTGWTVVIVDQVKDAKGKVTKRTLARVLSPSTHLENISSIEIPFLTTIYINALSQTEPPKYGIASLDLTTGQTVTFFSQATGRPDIWTADYLVQNLSIFQPKEIVVYWYSTLQKPPANLRMILSIPETTTLHVRTIQTLGAFTKELANAEYLRKAYSIKSLLPPKEYLGLRSTVEEIALLFLIQFVEEHLPSANQKLCRNEPWVPNLQLVCGNHALTQLQITSQKPGDMSVISLFSNAITPMGKRGLMSRLLRPLTCAKHIQKCLDEIEEIQHWENEFMSKIIKQLRFCYDIPRLHRKMLMGTLQLGEYCSILQTYDAISNIISYIPEDSLFTPTFTALFTPSPINWNSYLLQFQSHIDSKKAFEVSASNGVLDVTPFKADKYPELASIEKEIQDTLDLFEKERKNLCTLGGLPDDGLRLEAREKEPFGIKGSKAQLQILQKNQSSLPKGTHLTILKAGGWIDIPALSSLNSKLTKLRDKLVTSTREVHLQVCSHISEAGQSIWPAVEEWITHLDVSYAIAQTSIEKGFTKPTIIQDADESFVEIKGLRHPLVEASATRISYVQHDISLGKTTDSKGYLIYGMNASGKSTLMKATGVAVLLAQAGCYVPAQSMEIAPFRGVYTRILNQDNLFAGLSSFAVEMSELRDILSSADANTLVLGDELCAGTESISAEALVAAGIQWLTKQSSKFIFATHLHNLPKLLNNHTYIGLKIYHLHVDYDPVTKKLIYDRSLRPGSGSSLYGLEVARAMDLPLEFIEQALENRHKIIGSATYNNSATTTWNSEIIRHKCEVCENPILKDLEVHHIEQRSLANEHGILPNGKPMNSPSNLIVLCETCHDKHHSGKLHIGELVQTSEGPERKLEDLSKYAYKSPSNTVHNLTISKWSDEEMETIQKLLKQFKTVSLKMIQNQLQKNYDISISISKLGQLRKELS
jgi:DNA mismatch repair protein MutS